MQERLAEEPLMPGDGLMTIGALSRETGIPVPTLRTWERRYGQPSPLRRPSGHRLYPIEWVERLRRVDFLLRQGHRAANVLVLPASQLDSMITLSQARPVTPQFVPSLATPVDTQHSIERLMVAVEGLERGVLLGELRFEWGRLGPLRFLTELLGPFMNQIGESWRKGTLDIRHEHFTSAAVRGMLHELRQPYDNTARGPRFVLAALPGDQHDIGLLMVALVMAMRGRRVMFLGADMPLDETVRAAESQRAVAVAVSISASFDRSRAEVLLAQMRTALSPGIDLWYGGSESPAPGGGQEQFETLYQLDERLAPAN